MDTPPAGFDWDDANRSKCDQHGVSITDIEAMFTQPVAVFPAPFRSKAEVRFIAIGKSAQGRHVFVVFTSRSQGGELLIRPISARYMHQKEVKHYEEQSVAAEKAAPPE